jgi:excinuclease ABC subunit B
MNKAQLEKAISNARRNMEKAAKDLMFPEAARYRDEMFALQKMMDEKFGK